jgi:CubicO group peptidase (beta-lactamase class C family)
VHAAAGLAVTASDMVRIGQLWLNAGMWNGEQILDPGYVKEASENQVPNSRQASGDMATSGGSHPFRLIRHIRHSDATVS